MNLLKYFYSLYPYRTLFVCIGVLIASIVTAITLLALPVLLVNMIGKNTAKTELFNQFFIQIGITPTTENLMVFLITGILIQNLVLSTSKVYAGFTVAKIVKDIRIKLLSTMSKTEWSYFLKQSSGAFTSSLVNQADQAGDGYMTMIEILAIGVQVCAYISIAFLLSWEIALIAILTSLGLAVLFSKLISISKQLGRENTSLISIITSQITDLYRSVKPLKAMARESDVNAILDHHTKKLKAVNKKQTLTSELLDMLQEIVLMSAIIFTIYYSFKHLNLPLEFAVILVILYLRSMKLFGKAQKKYQHFVENVSGFDRVSKVIENAQAHKESHTGTKQHTLQGDIIIQNVDFSYVGKEVFNHLSIKFDYHKLNSVIGPSGIGKTTLVDLLCGLYQPSCGNILIDGIPLTELDIIHWRKQIGYVVQDNQLLNSSIKENITLGSKSFSDAEVIDSLKRACAYEFVESLRLGIDTIVGENGSKLSGGQRQRILIARALVHRPKLLILDEATSALDMKTEADIATTFKALSRETTIISISHRPALIEESDHVINLEKLT